LSPLPRRNLAEAVLDPGFTPRARDLDPLVDLLADDAVVKPVERAIARLGPSALEGLHARFAAAVPPLRARVFKAIARLIADPRARATALSALSDRDPKTRRNAAIALGHVTTPAERTEVEAALLAAWRDDPRPEMRRTIAASLGKVGGPASAALLSEASGADDAELARIASRASLMAQRTASRPDGGRVDDGRAPGRPVDVEVSARRGLEGLLAQELRAVQGLTEVRVTAPGRVRARLADAPRSLFAARTMLSFAFPLPTEWLAERETLEEGVARALAGAEARAVLAAFTDGAPRYRVAWAGGGHRRAATWDVVKAVAERRPDLTNDPTASAWEVVIAENGRFVDVSLAPRALDDPRFAWRRADVPAASHPTIAAALARVAGARDDDVAWDPFVGSGSELVERARLGPYVALHGSDIEPRALEAARANLDAAGVRATLERGDALLVRPAGVTLVITNPPMGRRAARSSGLADLLDRLVGHVATVLVPGGRFVWITPWAARARAAAARAGLALDEAWTVDMGGFDAELQRWRA
jgi:23S rRNA G2445 N2-methylase RlmL